MESKKFKKSFMGGFDKEDVMKYIEEIQKQNSEKKSVNDDSEEIKALKEENERLAEALRKSNEQLKLLADPVEGSNKILASSIAYSTSHYNSITDLVNGLCRTTNESAVDTKATVEDILSFAKKSEEEFTKNYNIFKKNLETLRKNLKETIECFGKIEEASTDTSKKTKAADAKIENLMQKAEKLLGSIENQQKENSELLEKVKK